MNHQTYFQTFARYNAWATARLLESVDALSDTDYRRDVGLFFKSIHGTLNHLLVAEHLLWYPRFAQGVSPKLALDHEAEADRSPLKFRLLEGVKRWEPLIASWDVERFEGKLDYTTTKGVAASFAFAPTLAHVFNHGTHHRGQITAALTMLGQPGPVIDLVYMLQEESNKS
jgi:uncharacterized damage-inducible protein DinB